MQILYRITIKQNWLTENTRTKHQITEIRLVTNWKQKSGPAFNFSATEKCGSSASMGEAPRRLLIHGVETKVHKPGTLLREKEANITSSRAQQYPSNHWLPRDLSINYLWRLHYLATWWCVVLSQNLPDTQSDEEAARSNGTNEASIGRRQSQLGWSGDGAHPMSGAPRRRTHQTNSQASRRAIASHFE